MPRRQHANLVGRKVAIQPLEGEFAPGIVVPDATIERLLVTKGKVVAHARLDVPIVLPAPTSGMKAQVDRVILEPYHGDLRDVFQSGGPSGLPVVAEIRCQSSGAPEWMQGFRLGKAALWRAPDSFDATPAKIPTHFEMKVRGVEARAENLGNSLREQHGVKLNFDEESLLRLDDLIDRLVKPPVDPQKLSTVVVPWADFLTKAVAVVFSGHLFQDPGNGIRVRIATRSGIIATSPDSQMWSRLEQGRNDETSITRYIERLKQEVKLRGGLQR